MVGEIPRPSLRLWTGYSAQVIEKRIQSLGHMANAVCRLIVL